MKKLLVFTLLVVYSLLGFAQKDEFVGFYKGEVQGLKKLPWFMPSHTMYAEVHRSEDSYRIRLQSGIFARADNFFVQENLKVENGKIFFKGEGDKFNVEEGVLSSAGIDIKGTISKSKISLSLKRYNPPQKTLGLKAPAGATVIFDGSNTSGLVHKDGSPCQWKIDDSAISVNTNSKKGAVYSKDAFEGDFLMHVEFMCPPDSYHLSGQKRNNSGVYIGDYEVQVLDSFGVESLWEDCGAIYRQSPPRVNACLEAGAWQTYDIIFSPAKFVDDKLVANPSISVYQNGIKIQSDTPISTATAGNIPNKGTYKHPRKGLKIMLQEHKNKVQFRNIWLLPLKNTQEVEISKVLGHL